MHKLYLDLETTGSDATKDWIVELAIKVVDEEGNVLVDKAKLYNPGIPISKEATEIHGWTNANVFDKPSFKSDAKKLKLLIENKIIVTFNGLVFDLPILMREFERAGVDVELSGLYIDVLKVERKVTPNNLSAVYKRYTGKDLENAHNGQSDVGATQVVLEAQIEQYGLTDDELYEMSGGKDMADFYGKLKYDKEGFLVFNFGAKCRGKRVIDEPSYAAWVLGEASFPSQVKKMIREEQTKGIKKETLKSATKSFFDGSKTLSRQEPLYANDDLPF